MEPETPLDRTLRDLHHRLLVLEDRITKLLDAENAAAHRRVMADADATKGRRLLGDLLILIGRRLRDERD